MILSRPDARLFLEIYCSLLGFVNDEYDLMPDFGHLGFGSTLDGYAVHVISDKLWDDTTIIDSFIKSRRHTPRVWCNILDGWKRYHLPGTYILMRQYEDFAMLLDQTRHCLWAVTGITAPIASFLSHCPAPILLTLIPFKDKIVPSMAYNNWDAYPEGGTLDGVDSECQQILESEGLRRSFDNSVNNLSLEGLRDEEDFTEENLDPTKDFQIIK
jgi:hypothetical protein